MEINPEEAGLKKYEVVREFRSDGNFNRITYMLIIRFLRLEDAGEYKCYVLIPDSTSQPYRIGQLNLQCEYTKWFLIISWSVGRTVELVILSSTPAQKVALIFFYFVVSLSLVLT